MHDDQLRRLFHSLERNDEPDPAFADALFNRLSFTAQTPARSRAPFLLLAAALLVAALGAGVAVGSGLIKLPGLSREPLPAPSASPAELASPTPTVVPSSSPTAEATPTPTAVPGLALKADEIVESTVDGLIVRIGTGTSSEKVGSLAAGQQAFVVGGPRQVDGYAWYRLSGLGLPQNSGCTGEEPTEPFGCPVWSGWAAVADLDGTQWLKPSSIDCPSPPDPFDTERTPIQQLACYGDTSLTLRGYWPVPPKGNPGICPIAEDEPWSWLACNPNLTHVTASEDAGYLEVPIFVVAVPPEVTMPEPGQWIEITGHYDDPNAKDCNFGDDPAASILDCRTQFAVETARPIAPPA